MSTRAIYSFKEPASQDVYHVYKHHDGSPEGAAEHLTKALEKAWPLPRYEANDFAASFVAANKDSGGGVRLLHSGNWRDVAPADIEYRYEVWQDPEGTLMVRGFETFLPWEGDDPEWEETEIFTAPLLQVQEHVAAMEVVALSEPDADDEAHAPYRCAATPDMLH